ncbi:MAG: hypothetical protein QE290_13835 [Acidovorax sp.]|uniref:hypothetical protein n=1 Tax=Acidovorax sp. TaxID=1872122 RepID=UPI0026152B9C|nr:hypothetical protein [Acidovorax sp.]MDH4465100.1 hypothetical protein [Acidovorax sp.]
MTDSNSSDRGLRISVDQLHAYLQSKQWHEDGKIRSVATIWHHPEDEDAEILVPWPSAKDYLPRMRQALSLIATFEGRHVADIIRDALRLLSNVISVRVIHNDTSDGTIPINDGVLLIAKARELLSAAAQSVYAKRRQFTGNAPKEARAYLDALVLGQTEIGSYVVNVIAPSQPLQNMEVGTAEVVPLGQAVTLNLVTGLEALERASEAYEEVGDLKAFDAAVLAGASANMCDALLGFSGERHQREFEIVVTATSGPMFEGESRRFAFNSRDVELLEKVSGYYKDDYVLPQRRLTGYITKLSRAKGETSGTIVVDSMLGDTERKIRIDLSGDDYHMAVLAHDNSKMVRVIGDVHIQSKSARLLNPANFGVIENEDLF